MLLAGLCAAALGQQVLLLAFALAFEVGQACMQVRTAGRTYIGEVQSGVPGCGGLIQLAADQIRVDQIRSELHGHARAHGHGYLI